jgi:S1-C subfamily serine protease
VLLLVVTVVLALGAVIAAGLAVASGGRGSATNSGLDLPSSTSAPTAPPSAAAPGPTSTSTLSADAAAIAAKVNPWVVDINTTLGLQNARAAGTGVVLTGSGEVLTNNHVIDGATSITATDIGNGRTYQATVVGYDRTRDLAVLQLQSASNLATASIGDASKVKVGDNVLAIGNALGKGGTPAVAPGQVTALDQSITASDENGDNPEHLTGLIEIAADVQPGDSGGPLVNTAGQVIGIDTAASTDAQSHTTTGQGYAIPIQPALAVAKQIEAGQASATVHIGATAFLGVQGTAATGGVAISSVVPGSPAEQAGLTQGDIITTLDGTAVDSPATLSNLLFRHHPGDRVKVGTQDQNGKTHTFTVRLGTGPAA